MPGPGGRGGGRPFEEGSTIRIENPSRLKSGKTWATRTAGKVGVAGRSLTVAVRFVGRPVPGDVGMTGEVTLRGRVLPVGGIKMKVLAAHRAGLTTVVLPKRNEKDLDDLPDEVRNTMLFVLVDHIDEALPVVFSSGTEHPEEETLVEG